MWPAKDRSSLTPHRLVQTSPLCKSPSHQESGSLNGILRCIHAVRDAFQSCEIGLILTPMRPRGGPHGARKQAAGSVRYSIPMLTRRSFLSTAAAAGSARGSKGRKPNFLFVIADDHAGYVL